MTDFLQWLNSDNVVKIAEDTYIEQCSQWKRKMTYEQIKAYFFREFKQ